MNIQKINKAASRRHRSGSFLIEAIVALALLFAIAMILFSGTIDIITSRNWTIHQNFSDAYLTYEEAYAKRIPFDDLLTSSSPWGITNQETNVLIGKTHGGQQVTGTVKRIRTADPSNSDAANNPAAMETYILYSVLTYRIGGNDYAKNRTIIRTR